MMLTLIVLHMVILHTVDGHEVLINPEQVTHLIAPMEGHEKSFTDEVKCMISLTDGKFVTVAESCDAVTKLLEEAK